MKLKCEDTVLTCELEIPEFLIQGSKFLQNIRTTHGNEVAVVMDGTTFELTLNVVRNHERGQKLPKEDIAKAVNLTETFDLTTPTFRKIIDLDLSPKELPNYKEYLYSLYCSRHFTIVLELVEDLHITLLKHMSFDQFSENLIDACLFKLYHP